MKKLFIISNESVFNNNGSFFCDNLDMKSTPEGLNQKFEVNIIARESKKARSHKINIKNIAVCRSIFSYVLNIFRSFKEKNSKFLLVSITPYTVVAAILIKLFKKKSSVFLRSDGFGEYKAIIGFLGPLIYQLMFFSISRLSSLVSCRKYILRGKKGDIVEPSQLTEKWFQNLKEANLSKILLLYVGRIKIEKGIFSLIDLFKKIPEGKSLLIVGAEKNFKLNNLSENIGIKEIEPNEERLMSLYDQSSIFILPSFTEGHPMTLLEALSRNRPVIIFEEIEHVIGKKKGVFVSKRNSEDLNKTINYIIENYQTIQQELKINDLPTKDKFLKNMSIAIENN